MSKVGRRAGARALIDSHTRLAAIAIGVVPLPFILIIAAFVLASDRDTIDALLLGGAALSLVTVFGLLIASFLVLRRRLYAFAADRMAVA
ncbi:MAG: hypothetical protein HY371_15605, partial [Devosia nanyangense]|nr:hypothetical protein [Devosia nanyangense]